ncbi:hypothetical protein JHW43_002214 [Diplocarpon mali]|nr:hypothetical protein JHW43_002214 [Diplocarpon mali]
MGRSGDRIGHGGPAGIWGRGSEAASGNAPAVTPYRDKEPEKKDSGMAASREWRIAGRRYTREPAGRCSSGDADMAATTAVQAPPTGATVGSRVTAAPELDMSLSVGGFQEPLALARPQVAEDAKLGLVKSSRRWLNSFEIKDSRENTVCPSYKAPRKAGVIESKQSAGKIAARAEGFPMYNPSIYIGSSKCGLVGPSPWLADTDRQTRNQASRFQQPFNDNIRPKLESN